MQLQYFEDELARMTQRNFSILEYFLKIKTLYVEISKLDIGEPMSNAHLHYYLI